MIILLPQEYNYVIWVSLLIATECFFFGFIFAGGKRKVFTQEFMDKNFAEEHKKAFPNDKNITKGGYPDTGSGRYAKKLPYKDWFEFNLGQRIHMSFVEQVVNITVALLLAGIKYPIYSTVIGGVYFLGKIINGIGYSRSVEGKKIGNSISSAALIFSFGLGIASLVSFL
jgi:hypothetical protein